MFIAVWEFQVHEASRAPFESLYGADGAWVALFRADPAYRGSELLADREHPGRYLTIDRWESAEAYHTFRHRHADAYATLDAQGDALTTGESRVGEFDIVVP